MDTLTLERVDGKKYNLHSLNTWEVLAGDDVFPEYPYHALQNITELYETTNEGQTRIIQFLLQFMYDKGVEDAKNNL